MREIHIVAIVGSLRQDSFNKKLYEAAKQVAPEGIIWTLGEIGTMPLFNEDVEAQGLPESVVTLGQQINSADAVLIVSPEYNHSMPGVLKNGLDWLSRIRPKNPFYHKPVAIMGASMGMFATVRMQAYLRQTLLCLDAYTLNKPDIMVGAVHTKFDAEGKLIDPQTAEFISQQLSALIAWTQQLNANVSE